MRKNLILLILVSICISTHAQKTFQNEKQMYKTAKKEKDAALYIAYFDAFFPQGIHVIKAQKYGDDIVYNNAIQQQNYQQLSSYQHYFPKGIHHKNVKKDLDKIATFHLDQIIASEDYEVLNAYILEHTGANQQITKVKERIHFLDHSKVYKKTLKTNTLDAYVHFLKSYRKSNYYDEIVSQLYQITVQKKEIKFFKKFLNVNASPNYNDEIYAAWWELVSEENNQKKYLDLLDYTSESNPFHAKAQAALHDIDFIAVIQKNTLEGYRNFITQNNPNKDKIIALLKVKDTQAFNDAKKTNTSPAYNQYISQFPSGIYAKEALLFIKESLSRIEVPMEPLNELKQTSLQNPIVSNIKSLRNGHKIEIYFTLSITNGKIASFKQISNSKNIAMHSIGMYSVSGNKTRFESSGDYFISWDTLKDTGSESFETDITFFIDFYETSK
ncbi:MAG: hypothetical protein COB98_10735 [Flavobacteriaceae bacterium]|nr:MAG: hypothetical protein COB98_10735 [Flavobacteriaceae bacterium]